MKQIAALLTVHNRKEKTLACLDALFDCSIPDGHTTDVYLVDDGCTDGTPGDVKDRYPDVKIIQGNGNLFWNRGMYLAWTTAAKQHDYDYYLWLNDDTILFPEAVEELAKCSEAENDRSIICGSTCATGNPGVITYGGRITGGNLVIPNGQKQYCDFFNGNIVLIPRHVYSVIGTNDPAFRHALGDFDYGMRARRKNIPLIVSPNTSGTCDDHGKPDAWCNSRTPFFRRIKLLYSPLGNNPVEFFKYENRHNGLVKACIHFFTNHLRAVCPSLWKNKQV